MSEVTGLKDDRLAALADDHNVAQFASFGPGDAELRHLRLAGAGPAQAEAELQAPAGGGSASPAARLEAAVGVVLAAAVAGTVNVRSFRPGHDKGAPFHYGLSSVNDVTALVSALAADGYYTIVNETIDIHDGGVSGVVLGGTVEFAPDDTPRAVEKPGTAAAPLALARDLLTAVYGVPPDIDAPPGTRVEFSVHPRRCGHRHQHTLWWEAEDVGEVSVEAQVSWPNRFSRHVGDKCYGLLVAHCLGLAVPETLAVGRRVAPFRFGRRTGTAEWWLRTCPVEQVPGRFTTLPHWTDPFALLTKEDPAGDALASVLAQEAVDARYSGATLPAADGDRVEGVAGVGDAFMLGERPPEPLPAEVVDAVRAVTAAAAAAVGPVRVEWAHDGRQVWVLQMHRAVPRAGSDRVIVPGDADEWWAFDVAEGLPRLRVLVAEAAERRAGIVVHGQVGLTSHVGDVLRKAGVPARLSSPGPAAG